MDTISFLASLWGFFLIIVCLAFLIKPRHIQAFFTLAENPNNFLPIGLLHTFLGLMSVLSYNVWSQNLTVIITILGWLLLAKGIFYLFAPESMAVMVVKWKANYISWFPIALVIGVVLGCALIYMGLTM